MSYKSDDHRSEATHQSEALVLKQKIFSSRSPLPNKQPMSATMVNEDAIKREMHKEGSVVINDGLLETPVYSITLPSLFDDLPSTHESEESEHSTTTVVYTDDKINAIMRQYIDIHGDELTDEMITSVQLLIEHVEENLTMFGVEYHRKLIETLLMKRFSEIMPTDNTEFSGMSLADRIIRHTIMLICVHKMLLQLYLTDLDKAHDLLQQIAVSHALMKLTSDDFRMMNISFGKYLLKQGLMNDDNMPPLVTYFNKFTRYITSFYDTRQFRTKSSPDMFKRGYTSKPRENYRIMKKWKITVEGIKEKAKRFQKLFATEIEVEELIDEDDVTLETAILKQRHWCLGKCVKKPVLQPVAENERDAASED